MTRGEATSALALGARITDELVDDGADLLIGGDMGIGNTTSGGGAGGSADRLRRRAGGGRPGDRHRRPHVDAQDRCRARRDPPRTLGQRRSDRIAGRGHRTRPRRDDWLPAAGRGARDAGVARRGRVVRLRSAG